MNGLPRLPRAAALGAGRAPLALGIAHTGITVSNLPRSIAFYADVLGFEVSRSMHVEGEQVARVTGVPDASLDVAFVRTPNLVLELLCFRQPRTLRPSPLRTCDPGFFHLCLKVRDIDAMLAAIRAHDFLPLSPIERITQGPAAGMQIVYVRDPDGVTLELAEDAPGVVFEDLFFMGR